ncbi:MAG: hypothetical protein NVS1B16_09610 [Pseudarthrobacter sp.]
MPVRGCQPPGTGQNGREELKRCLDGPVSGEIPRTEQSAAVPGLTVTLATADGTGEERRKTGPDM